MIDVMVLIVSIVLHSSMFCVIMELPDFFIKKVKIKGKGFLYYAVYGAFTVIGAAVCFCIGMVYGFFLDKMGISVKEWVSSVSFFLSFFIWKTVSEIIDRRKKE